MKSGNSFAKKEKSTFAFLKTETAIWGSFGLLLLIFAGCLWTLKGPTAEEMAGAPGFISDYLKSFEVGWSPQFLLGKSTALLNVSFLAFHFIGFINFILSPFVDSFTSIKVAGLILAGLSGISMFFFVCEITPNKKTSSLAGFLYLTMPSIIVRSVMYEHVAVSMAFLFVPLIMRGMLILTRHSSPREILLLGLSSAGLSLSYTKMSVTILPILLIWGVFCLTQSKVPKIRIFLCYFWAGSVAVLAGLTILLPALNESIHTAVFAFDPMEAWQKHYSFKTPLSWIDLSKFFLSGAGPDFESDSQFFFIGAIPLILVTIGLASDGLSVWRQTSEGRWFLVLLSCWLMTLWMASGPRGILGNQIYLLSCSQGMRDYALPLVWAAFFWMSWMVWKVLYELTNSGRVVALSGIALFLLVPVFNLLSKLPFLNDIRGPESYWSVAGFTCLVAATALTAIPLLTSRHSSWKIWRPIIFPTFLVAYMLHFIPVYSTFTRAGLNQDILHDYQLAAKFLKEAARPGRVYPVSSRYFYLTIPEITGRGISTEAAFRHFQLKWVRYLEVASQNSGELLQRYINFAGVAYLLIDKSDGSVSPDVCQSFQRVFPLVYANNSFAILENRGDLYPGFLAHDYVAFSKESYLQASSILQLARLNFLAVENSNPDLNEKGLAGISKGGEEVELTPNFRDRLGRPFQILNLENPRNADFSSMCFMLPSLQEGGWVAATEAWHPSWKAFVDGVEKPTSRVAAALLGVHVEPGNRQVEFRFVQPFWYAGLIEVGVFSWALGCIAFVTFQSRFLPERIQNWWDGKKNCEIPQDRTVEIKTKKSEQVEEKGGNQGSL